MGSGSSKSTSRKEDNPDVGGKRQRAPSLPEFDPTELESLHPPEAFLRFSPPRIDQTLESKRKARSEAQTFPTPNLLMARQREYAARGVRHEIDPATGVPGPFPPPDTKDQVFRPQDYKHIDEKARNVPISICNGPMQGLVDYLIQWATNDIGKVRAFYVWVCQQRDSGENTVDADLDNAYNKLVLARHKKYNYANLLAEMCSCAGIPCEQIRGCTRNFLNQGSTDFDDDSSAWNAVFVDGAWRFIDANFGSGYLEGGKNKWKLVDTDLQNQRDAEDEEEKRVFQMNEDYFLTDPELFIYNHFPKTAEWQLLARPVTKEEFSIMAQVRKAYFDWSISDMSEPRGNFSTNTGEMEMTFTPSPDQLIKCSYILYKNIEDGEQDPSKHLNQLVRLENIGKNKHFQIRFTEIGLYKFHVYVSDIEVNTITLLVTYYIRCNCPYFEEVKNPRLPEGLQELGPDPTWTSKGIKCSISGGVIQAQQGLARLRLEDGGKLSYLFKLFPQERIDDDSEELANAIIADQQVNVVNLCLKMPHHGHFLLKVYTRPPGANTFRHSCNFIVKSNMKCVTDLFPLRLQKYVGNVSHPRVLLPITTPHSYLALSEAPDDLLLEFSILQKRFFMIELIHHRDGTETKLDEFCWFEKVGDKLRCHVRLPKSGIYSFKVYEKEDESVNSYNLSFRYLLEVEKPACSLPFPNRAPGWEEDMVLTRPTEKYLTRNTAYELDLTVPRAIRVFAEKLGEHIKQELLQDVRGTWKASMNSLSQTKNLVIKAQFPDIDEAEVLVWCQVSDDTPFEAARADHEAESQYAAAKQEEKEQLLRQEKLEAEKRAQEAKDKSAAAKVDFLKRCKERFANGEEIETDAFQRKVLEMNVSSEIIVSMQRYLSGYLSESDVLTVAMAMLLLLGNNEQDVASADACEQRLRDIGAEKIVQQMMHVDIMAVQHDVITRVTELLEGVNQQTLRDNTPMAALAYDWVRSCVLPQSHCPQHPGIDSDATELPVAKDGPPQHTGMDLDAKDAMVDKVASHKKLDNPLGKRIASRRLIHANPPSTP